MAGSKGHRFFVFRKRRVVRRETKKCNQDRSRLSVANSGGRGDNSGTDRKMRYSIRHFDQGQKMANMLLQGKRGLFLLCFFHAGRFHDGKENSTVTENGHDLHNEPDLC